MYELIKRVDIEIESDDLAIPTPLSKHHYYFNSASTRVYLNAKVKDHIQNTAFDGNLSDDIYKSARPPAMTLTTCGSR